MLKDASYKQQKSSALNRDPHVQKVDSCSHLEPSTFILLQPLILLLLILLILLLLLLYIYIYILLVLVLL